MNILYLLGALIFILVLGYAYFLFTAANKEKGMAKIVGWVLAGLLVMVLLLLIILYKTGAVGMPEFMPERPPTRMMKAMSGYVTGMMAEDSRAIDEFISSLRENPEVLEAFKDRLR